MEKVFRPNAKLEAKLKKLFFVSARSMIVAEVKKRGIVVDAGFVSWYSGHLWDCSKEDMLKVDQALKKWAVINRERRR